MKYLLEERKLKDCRFLDENESTDDEDNKYADWRDVLVLKSYISPLNDPPVLGSPVQTPKRTRSEHEGILDRMYSMYSPTLLDTRPNRQICFPRHPDHNFFIWGNPDNIVHRNDARLKSLQVMYSC